MGKGERLSIPERLNLHRFFWEGKDLPYPLAAFRLAKDFFFSRHFKAAEPLLKPGKRIIPQMLLVEEYLPDYLRMFQEVEQTGQDAFWTAEPFTGIPWMEAILGCEIYAGEESFTSKPWVQDFQQVDTLSLNRDNTWLKKYLEYTTKLCALSEGRFPVGMPIMRGPSDMVGALMGQTEMVYALEDDPQRMQSCLAKVTYIFLQVQRLQQSLIPSFHGGTALGFYHVWCPGPSIWYQDDLSALLSPELYRTFLLPTSRKICEGYPYTAVHLHPTSFFLLPDLLTITELKAVEVNKDVGGPSVKEMMKELKTILECKRLILWGDLTLEDLEEIKKSLPCRGLFFHIIAPSLPDAKERLQFIRNWRN
ncbi:MAG: hypothetical protein SNJ78_03190 [Spirochaetales bacterium]